MSPAQSTFLAAAAAAALLCGCAYQGVPQPSAAEAPATGQESNSPVVDAGIDAQDLPAAAERMARGILAIPGIASARSTPRIVLESVIDDTHLRIDRAAFLIRVRTQLNSRSQGRARFLDRGMMQSIEAERAAVRPSQAPGLEAAEPVKLHGPDYVLTGRLQQMPPQGPEDGSGHILYTFRIADAHTNEVLWEDSAEIRREDFVIAGGGQSDGESSAGLAPGAPAASGLPENQRGGEPSHASKS